ncbi:YjbQ family protein [Methylobacterium planeticum]|uniref:YjbQ family protein n=2 Tax=Methylobacterium planeticum TaxID=2615211 RepID=A0A6N6MJA6_9HYPH|nr:secondary thiamine-phosphate synthase enzyme YjbQ [Methylobacterium planeticum]KAB1070123.1 YjbQ family protein [Methylobacterium planeticum]
MQQGRIGAIEGVTEGEVRRQAGATLTIATQGPGLTDFTRSVVDFVRRSGLRDGLVSVFCRHTSASLTIQENADPDVQSDLMTALDGLAPRHAGYIPGAEGPDDMPAHIRTMVTDAALTIPLRGGHLALGTWQGIYLIEHRDRPHRREIVLQVVGA